jgi:hypothetical protein
MREVLIVCGKEKEVETGGWSGNGKLKWEVEVGVT